MKKDVAVSESGFLFNPETGDSYSLNPIGTEIVKLLQEKNSDEHVIEHILKEYAIDRHTIEKDLYDFKNMLNNYKLMTS